MDIVSKYNLSDRLAKLLRQFLEQSFSSIKMADDGGFYISDVIDTVRGSPQGQIGSDFVFALINDGIDPEQVYDEIIMRTKYVDDFTDVLGAFSISTLISSYIHNENKLKAEATSCLLYTSDAADE